MQRIVVISGAGSGIGAATAVRFAQQGDTVILLGRRPDALNAVAQQCDGRAVAIPCDVSNTADVAQAIAQVQAQFGRIDVLVSAAGTNLPDRAVSQLTPASWQMMIDINMTGAFYLISHAIPLLRVAKGVIIAIGSTSVPRPSSLGGASYNAAKSGLTAFVRTLAQEEAAHGVRATMIQPGEVDTPLIDKRPAPVSAERRAAMLQADDVAQVITFVADLPARATIPELILTPSANPFV
ncbi:MAG: SDR family oxidoreductase [Chloroflexi bacterium]|nr:SDR family oxidoreductase [Chloroflexota bacterium]